MSDTADDGAVVTVTKVATGWEMTCSVCPVVSAGTREQAEQDADYHLDWHNRDR